MKKRILALLMLGTYIVSAFLMTACSQNTEDLAKATEETTAETLDTDNLTEMQKRQLVSDELPEVNFDNRDFRVLCPTDKEFEAWSEELNGDICNDAVYQRNIDITERFNVNIVAQTTTSPQDKITALVLANTDDFELVTFESYLAFTPIASKVLHNWYDVEYVNLEKPWYNKLSNETSTINDKLFAVSSDFSISTMMYTMGIFFNQELIEDYGYTADGLYQMVFDGEWTIDRFNEIISLMYDDMNASGKVDKGDQFGFSYFVMNPADVWFTALGQKYLETDDTGKMSLVYMNETTMEKFSYLYDMHINNDAVYLDGSYQYVEEETFLNRETVFAPLRFYAAYTTLRNREFDLGILPYPKWDTAQEKYYTAPDDKFTLAAIPLTVKEEDLPFVGIVFEALNAYTYKDVYPVYYDLALKNKYTDDPITAEIIDIIMDGQCFDLVFQFCDNDHFYSLPYIWRELLSAKNPNLSSLYASREPAILIGIEKIYEYYED